MNFTPNSNEAPDLLVQLDVHRVRLDVRGTPSEPVQRQGQADHEPLRRADVGGPGRQQGRGQVGGRPRTVDRRAIPWLRLSADSTAAGPDGDELVATTYIQRIATKGGLAPSVARCDKRPLGTQVESPYTADYFFYKKDDCSRAGDGDAPSSG